MKLKIYLLISITTLVIPLWWSYAYAKKVGIGRPTPAREAPRFRGKTVDNRDISMLDLTLTKSVVVCFSRVEDKDKSELVSSLSLLQRGYGDKLQVVLILTGDEKPVYEWATRNSGNIAVLPDAQGEFAKDYKATECGDTFLIERGGNLSGSWKEFRPTSLAEISLGIAKEWATKPAQVDFGRDRVISGGPL